MGITSNAAEADGNASNSGWSSRLYQVRLIGGSMVFSFQNWISAVDATAPKPISVSDKRIFDTGILDMAQLSAGDKAPDFNLPGSSGASYALGDYKSGPLILYFYPKDDTSGCTVEGLDFTALIAEFAAVNAKVLGVSPDSPQSHDKFCKKHGLGIDLASDESKAMLESYGVWAEKSMYGKKYMGVERSTFLIDKNGVIAKAWHKVKVPGHAAEVLEATKAL
jgi:thioredoxin-dependent peroxiredoxin